MADDMDKTRLLVARLEGERWPVVVGAIPQTSWGVIPEDEWSRIKREMAEKWLGPDWTAYDYIEVVVTIPAAQLADLFDAREITPLAVERAEEGA
jgi:hypothetical protein